jgi:UDP-3-O-[3-hydroxymyristoyl] glucosamine N-acyltransferase
VAIGPGAAIADKVVICANATIGRDVEIGEKTVIFEGTVIKSRCRIGRRVRIGPNCVVGFDGFGYYQADGKHNLIAHIGNVVIEDDVDLGACVCVDRAKFGSTRVGEGTKVDNLVQIAHNVQIGKHCILVGQCGIAGSTRVGNYVVIGGNAGVRDNITIGDGAKLAAYSATPNNVPAGESVGGAPSRPMSKMRRITAAEAKLPELVKRVRALEAKVNKTDESTTDN